MWTSQNRSASNLICIHTITRRITVLSQGRCRLDWEHITCSACIGLEHEIVRSSDAVLKHLNKVMLPLSFMVCIIVWGYVFGQSVVFSRAPDNVCAISQLSATTAKDRKARSVLKSALFHLEGISEGWICSVPAPKASMLVPFQMFPIKLQITQWVYATAKE